MPLFISRDRQKNTFMHGHRQSVVVVGSRRLRDELSKADLRTNEHVLISVGVCSSLCVRGHQLQWRRKPLVRLVLRCNPSMKLCFSLTSLSFGLRCRVPGVRRVLVDFHWVQWLRLKKTWRQARGCRAMFSTSRLVECRSVFSPGPSSGILCGSELLWSLLR